MDRYNDWSEKYAAIAKNGNDRRGIEYTDEAYATFPRYNVLSAILLGIEKLDFDCLPPLAELKELLEILAQTSQTIFTENLGNEIAVAVDQEERDLFCGAIQQAEKNKLSNIEPLFYRRVLDAEEVKKLWQGIEKNWGADGSYWYPLDSKTHPSLIAYNLNDIDEAALQKNMHDYIANTDINRVFELREYGDENYLVDLGAEDFCYSGAEGFWISAKNDWIVYCSHENTITLGGSIVEAAKGFKALG